MEPTLPVRTDQEFEALMGAYRSALRRFAQRLERSPEDAEDLLQESVVDAYRAFGNFRPGSNFYSWMSRIITNNHLDRVRKKRVSTVSLEGTTLEGEAETLDLPDESSNPERTLLTGVFDQRLEAALETLLPAQRQTVMLCDLDGASYEEAAQAQGCPIGTIRSRLHRAHAALQRFLAGSGIVAEGGPNEPVRTSRRNLLRMGTAVAAGVVLAPLTAVEPAAAEPAEIRVRVWTGEPAGSDETERHTRITRGLRRETRLQVAASTGQLDTTALDETDVLVMAGGEQGGDLAPEVEEGIIRRVREGRLGLVVTGNAGACRPLARVLGQAAFQVELGGHAGEAITVRVSAPRHPVAAGLSEFSLRGQAGSAIAFAGPKPDVIVLRGQEGSTETGSWQGMAWTVGQGRVFCFLPGLVPSEVYGQEAIAQVLRNAVDWCARA